MTIYTWNLQAQVTLTNDFEFENGVFLSLEQLRKNKPAHNWQEVESEAHIDGDRYQIRLGGLSLRDGSEQKLEEIAAITVDGEPYLNVNEMLDGNFLSPDTDQQPIIFVKLQVKGSLCYFYFEGFQKTMVPMNIYDPQRGILIRTVEVEETKPLLLKKIMVFETGVIHDYDLYSFLKIVKNEDSALYKTLADLSESEARDKLYKSLFIYNDRNPFIFQE